MLNFIIKLLIRKNEKYFRHNMYFSYSRDADEFILQSKNLGNKYCVRYDKPIKNIFNDFKLKYGIKWYNILDETTKNMWLYYANSFRPVILSKKNMKII